MTPTYLTRPVGWCHERPRVSASNARKRLRPLASVATTLTGTSGPAPCVYVGKVTLYRVSDLAAWLDRSAVRRIDPKCENAPALLKQPGARHRRH